MKLPALALLFLLATSSLFCNLDVQKELSGLPKVAVVEDSIVISNFDITSFTASDLSAFINALTTIEICSSVEDIYFPTPNTCIIKASPSFLADVIQRDLETEKPIATLLCSTNHKRKLSIETLKQEEAKNKEQIAECQTTCAAVTRAGEIACLKLGSPAAQMACVAILEISLFRCKTCCEVGMGHCFDKFMEAMQPHIQNFFNTKEL